MSSFCDCSFAHGADVSRSDCRLDGGDGSPACSLLYSLPCLPQRFFTSKTSRLDGGLVISGGALKITQDNETISRRERLNTLDFVWNVEHYEWNLHSKKLVDFHQTNGYCIAPDDDKDNQVLAIWVVE